MTSLDSTVAAKGSRESNWVIAGLCAIVASSILVEVCLTKFVSYKVYYHFVYAIISTVILSAGLAGTCVHLFPKRFGKEHPDPWSVVAKSAWLYAISLIIVTVLFCWLPFDPYKAAAPTTAAELPGYMFLYTAPVALYFMMFAIPFFFAGLCVSCTLVISTRSAAKIYFFDLLAAAVGALLCSFSLEYLGGYGTVLAASALGMVGYFCYGKVGNTKSPLLIPSLSFAAAAALILWYPQWATQQYGFDIRTNRNVQWHDLVRKDLNGINATYWNVVTRVDVTNTGQTKDFDDTKTPVSCRFVLVDGSAPTRQLKCNGDLLKDPNIGKFLWAAPYIANPHIQRSMIIGPGGGIDILIGKYFGAKRVDAVELNPSTYKHVLLGQGDSEAELYQPWLRSTDQTEIVIHNTEGRHFASTMPAGTFDLVQATCVDTLTAITSGALSMVENYLYTADAVKDYVRILKPNGILSLTHWRTEPAGPSVRMFVTYLDYLDSIGVQEPGKCIVVVGHGGWTDEMMKTTPFTEAEMEPIRAWVAAQKYDLIFDPYRHNSDAPGITPSEKVYSEIGFLGKDERKKILDSYARNYFPVNDDKPFFYKFDKSDDFFVPSLFSSTPLAFVLIVLIGSIALFLLPLSRVKKGDLSKEMLGFGACFALAGFAFLLYETCIIQLFSIFVGGPIYSLAVVLVCVLGGYATGSGISQRLKVTSKLFLILAAALPVVFLALYFGLPKLIPALMPLPVEGRIAITALLTYATSIVTGMPVSLAMTQLKGARGDVVAWMWGVSCASNALGAMAFALIAQCTGISALLILVAVFYAAANLGFSALVKKQTSASVVG